MRTRGWITTYLLASAVPCLEGLFPGLELARGASSALVLLAALVVLAWPHAADEDEDEPAARSTQRALLALLPPLGLAFGLDLARGLAPARAGATTLALAALVVGWVALARHAARAAGTRARYRAAWLVLGPGLAALALALCWVPRSAEDGSAAAGWALSPFVLAQRAALPDGFVTRSAREFLLAACGLALATLHVRRSAPGGRA